MARARLISNAITQDKRINQLMDDTSRLAYTWLITFADCEGRTPGDPAIVRAMLFPRREDITISQMDGYIRQWHELGLVVWYEAKDDMWIFFPAFFSHNKVNTERESPSKIPPPTHDQLMSNSGVTHDQLTVKLIKDKLIQEEDKTREPVSFSSSICSLYSQHIGKITSVIVPTLQRADQEYPAEWFPNAFEIAVGSGHKNWSYVEGILKNWKSNGYQPGKNGKGSKSSEHTADDWKAHAKAHPEMYGNE